MLVKSASFQSKTGIVSAVHYLFVCNMWKSGHLQPLLKWFVSVQNNERLKQSKNIVSIGDLTIAVLEINTRLLGKWKLHHQNLVSNTTIHVGVFFWDDLDQDL